jgi:hypothetical protein
MKNNKAFAEVIESSLHTFLSQTWQWNLVPQFGSLVTVVSSKRTVFGIVHQINTGSSDPVRQPFPYKKTHEELQQEQPQIFEFLKTTFSCITLGYKEKGPICSILPPEPVHIHSFIEHPNSELQKEFFSQQNYLHLLFGLSHQVFNIDELLLALLKQQQDLGILSDATLHSFIEIFSLLSGNDYRRLKLFLSRTQSLIM